MLWIKIKAEIVKMLPLTLALARAAGLVLPSPFVFFP
jgi:hypothetical protein